MEDKITLTKINVIGGKFFHVFGMDDGGLKEIETTGQDYFQLGSGNPTLPSLNGGKWDSSFSRHKYDTVNGDMLNKQFADNGGGGYLVKIDDEFLTVSKENITDGVIAKNTFDTLITKKKERLSILNLTI